MEKAFNTQELLSAILFFVPCGWLLVESALLVPDAAPSLWPLVPMFVAIVWYFGLEHFAKTEH